MADDDAAQLPPGQLRRMIDDAQRLTRIESEDLLRQCASAWNQDRSQWWRRDYASSDAYLQSVAPNRARWRAALGDAASLPLPPARGEVAWEAFAEDETMSARRLLLPIAGDLRARAVLAVPKGVQGPVPLVIAQHGIESSPEKVFGFDDPTGGYKGYGRALVQAGFAVLAPQHVTGHQPRSRLQRMCTMLGITLWGLELYKLQRLLDAVAALAEIDAERIGMWGISLGGAYTLFATPLEPRIRAAVCTAWFNDRFRKMIIDDPRYSCFLSTTEEYVFIPRWLVEFDDADLASLICPRPLLVQTGKADSIAWWPYVVETFERARGHYARLGLADAIELDLHEGGHEIRLESGIDFLKRRL